MADRRRVWLHIGMPKTGSTSLQKSFAASRAEMRAGGLFYPGREEAHHALSARLVGKGGGAPYFESRGIPPDRAVVMADKVWATVEAAERFEGDILLSSELFGRANEAGIERLDRDVAALGRELRVICYLRHPVALAHSSAQQQIKLGRLTLAESLEVAPIRRNSRYIQRFIDTLGRERVDVRLFEAAAKGGLLDDMLGALGFGALRGTLTECRANDGLSLAGVVLADAYHNTDERTRGFPPMLAEIGGRPFRLPSAAIEAARDRIDVECAFIRDTLGLPLGDAPKHDDATWTGPMLDREALRDIVRLIDRPRPSHGIRARVRAAAHALRGRG